MKKEELKQPVADREPMSEEACMTLEKLCMLSLVSVLHPEQFDQTYKSLYPLDREFNAIGMYSEMCQLLSLVAKSRMFRRDYTKYAMRLSVAHEREAWEMFKADNNLRSVENPMDSEIECHTSVANYLADFHKRLYEAGKESEMQKEIRKVVDDNER